MKPKPLAVAVSTALATVSIGASANSLFNYQEFSFIEEKVFSRQEQSYFSMFGGPNGQFQQTSYSLQEYSYFHQEIQMVNLTQSVSTRFPDYAGCSGYSCPSAQVITDPQTGTTMGRYPNGNTVMVRPNGPNSTFGGNMFGGFGNIFQQQQVYYSFEQEVYHFESLDYTMNSFCACNPSGMPSFLNYSMSRTTMDYSKTVERFVSNSTTIRAGKRANADDIDPNPVLALDESTKAELKQALDSFDELLENRQ